MKQGKRFFDVYAAKVDERYPHIKQQFPNVTHILAGTKITGGLEGVRQSAMKNPRMTKRKYPPQLRIFEI